MAKFVSGQSGNPKGRPSEEPLSIGEVLRRKVRRAAVKGRLAQELINLATKGKAEATRLQAAKLIFELIEGKPAARPTPKGDGSGKVEVTFEDGQDQTA